MGSGDQTALEENENKEKVTSSLQPPHPIGAALGVSAPVRIRPLGEGMRQLLWNTRKASLDPCPSEDQNQAT